MRVTRPTLVRGRRGPGRAAVTRLAVVGACATAAVTSTMIGPSASAHDSAGSTSGSTSASAAHARDGAPLAALKKSLSPYRDVDRALADGFIPVSPCTESPDGGMGYHYLNPARAMAPVDPTKPAILLYGPTADGDPDGRRLIGAEWFQADADQQLGTDDDRPSLWGRPFEGPMPGHDPQMPVHYDLHVWLFDSNPAGVFASWNPSVSC
ncbi:hypothetical protein G7072_16510 [Nocardioides sp. HDW12B]|uniref:hypothetical protein n=1 Tax=Nocardioides sp. HDW12B TaxID=2714939 RepID=UPI00140A691F|nr:hypothetical protein [Nocardioides sp. HDW12B]QIK67733.1 hypothetical protein G7072_16510 [Nocardioides sp. HDW12B]